jgi:hypothetical protein
MICPHFLYVVIFRKEPHHFMEPMPQREAGAASIWSRIKMEPHQYGAASNNFAP